MHRRGDRKEYFEAERDVWQMFENIIRERRRREVQPIIETLERCLRMVDEGKKGLRGQPRKEADACRKRYTDILEFCETMNTLFVPAAGVIADAFACYDPVPFGLVEDEFVTYALDQFNKRFLRLEKARGAALEEIERVTREVIEREDG